MANNNSIERFWCGKCKKFVYIFPGLDKCPECGTPKFSLTYTKPSDFDIPDFLKDLFK